ncbi:MAG: hypothetical protein ACRCSN_06660 [Dermatophilaceae bacterium]
MSFTRITESTSRAVDSGRGDLDHDEAIVSELSAALDGACFPADLDEVLAHLIRTRAPARYIAEVAVLPPVVFVDADEVCRSIGGVRVAHS